MTFNEILILSSSDISDVDLSFGDWLDGLQKTVENSMKQDTSASKGSHAFSV